MRKRHLILIALIIVVTIVASIGAYYLGYFKDDNGLGASKRIYINNQNNDNIPQNVNTEPTVPIEQENSDDAKKLQQIKIEEVVTELQVPWSIVFTSGNRMLVTERTGRLRAVVGNRLISEPIHTFKEVSSKSEEGLMGLTIDPDYQNNKYIYLCHAYLKNGVMTDKILRFKDMEDHLEDEKLILDDIPAATNHAGCKLKIGPDQKLYITTGDATDRKIAQIPDNLGGKILRINLDGNIPDDNPAFSFPGQKRPNAKTFSWTLGHRNSQGIDWTTNGIMFSAEHGPSGFDGPGGGDEINIIKKGQNYGWPIVSHERTNPIYVSPLLVFTPAIAPSALMVYKGEMFSEFKNNIFVALLKGEGILRVKMKEENGNPTEKVDFYEKMPEVKVGRVREIIEGPDGSIYFTSSNRDGRGKVQSGDDKIFRIYR